MLRHNDNTCLNGSGGEAWNTEEQNMAFLTFLFQYMTEHTVALNVWVKKKHWTSNYFR